MYIERERYRYTYIYIYIYNLPLNNCSSQGGPILLKRRFTDRMTKQQANCRVIITIAITTMAITTVAIIITIAITTIAIITIAGKGSLEPRESLGPERRCLCSAANILFSSLLLLSSLVVVVVVVVVLLLES